MSCFHAGTPPTVTTSMISVESIELFTKLQRGSESRLQPSPKQLKIDGESTASTGEPPARSLIVGPKETPHAQPSSSRLL